MSSALPILTLCFLPDPPSGLCQRAVRYSFGQYGILMYHPVTTEFPAIRDYIRELVDAVIASGRHYIVIYPNNDLGTEIILSEYHRLEGNPNFRIFPSIRFEYFLTFLRHAQLYDRQFQCRHPGNLRFMAYPVSTSGTDSRDGICLTKYKTSNM